MRKTNTRQWKNMLERRINELVSLTKDVCPEAEVTLLHPFEDEDAIIEVFVPSEKYDGVEATLTRRETEILLDDGFFIVTLIHEKKPVPVT